SVDGKTRTIGAASDGGTTGGSINLRANAKTAYEGTKEVQSSLVLFRYSVTKAGASTLTLTNNNTYSGCTTITAGTLTVDATSVEIGRAACRERVEVAAEDVNSNVGSLISADMCDVGTNVKVMDSDIVDT